MKQQIVGIPPALKLPTKHVTLPRLPRGDSEFPLRIMDVVWVAIAVGLVVAQIARLSVLPEIWTWSSLLAVLLAMPAADFVSGVIHWTFDTWGSEKTFFIGPRLIRPFRVHHTKPRDLLGSHFFTTNADASLANLPFLLLAFLAPTDWEFGRLAAVFLVALGTFGLPTSQIHKWAHAPRRPRWVSWLQRRGLILGPIHHSVHHAEPHTLNYCITTGWCNGPLNWFGFFPKAEWLVSKLTGMKPRKEEDHKATHA
jgi:plasmanylethanolamine desaturase